MIVLFLSAQTINVRSWLNVHKEVYLLIHHFHMNSNSSFTPNHPDEYLLFLIEYKETYSKPLTQYHVRACVCSRENRPRLNPAWLKVTALLWSFNIRFKFNFIPGNFFEKVIENEIFRDNEKINIFIYFLPLCRFYIKWAPYFFFFILFLKDGSVS